MLRKRKNRRYNETQDEEGDGERKFDLAELIKSKRFDDSLREKHLQELPGDAITLRFFQRNGFEKPILITKPDGLDLRVPPKSFLVRDVRNYVGHQRIIDVMDVKTQKNIEMSMKDWCKYYESRHRDRLLNVISLEFSHTKLDELVDSPMIVRLLDWVDLVWPKFLKESQTEGTNTIDKMKYPKVQKYCLMSVKGSYTDFHIDFGGTSVWYHILRGRKIFWMVPPTELNLQVFEEWTLSGMQQDVFFGDTVEECFRVELCAGNTFFIPSGWIHAVYTLEDSLVFGGNFLHSFGIENQLKVSRIEDATKVPVKFRYPFYTEILWYVVQHYVYCLMNKDHLHRLDLHAAEAAAAAAKQAAAEEAAKKLAIENSNNGKCNNVEIDDETTESEHEESDSKQTSKNNSKNKRSVAANKRKKKGKVGPAKKSKKVQSTTKKSRQPAASAHSDDSTDIDSANEQSDDETEVDEPKPKPTNTCRMTKNSLLRLQYEVEEQREKQQTTTAGKKAANKTTADSSDDNSSSSKNTKNSSSKNKKVERTSSTTKVQDAQTMIDATTTAKTAANATLNLADIMLSHETNGWSNKEGQTIWSNPNDTQDSNEPKKIHITRYEINGLKVLVKHLSKLSGAKKHLPSLIRNSRALLDDCKKLISEHENDDPELAITGKPITPDLLKPKKTGMNELIGQFFKPSTESTEMITDVSDNSNSLSMQSSNQLTDHLHHHKSERSVKHQQQHTNSISSSIIGGRQKHNSTSSTGSSSTKDKDDKKISSESSKHANTSANESSAASLSRLSPHKETKCLSPNKKLSSSTSAASTSSPPPRPKSPPTRPLSNNQYTSKTKNNNNLLLPGSFADLIAATSTEKKVFDVSSADVASSLYGIKDLGKQQLSSSSSSQHHQANKTASSATIKSEKDDLLSDVIGDGIKLSAGAGAGHHLNTMTKPDSHTIKSSSSPEPHKLPGHPQKRFITPATFKPQQSKEKLIYASAPYISPVHSTYDQTRSAPSSSNHPYSWQASTPSTHQHQHQHHHHNQNQQLHQQQQQSQQHDHQQSTYSPATPLSSAHHPHSLPTIGPAHGGSHLTIPPHAPSQTTASATSLSPTWPPTQSTNFVASTTSPSHIQAPYKPDLQNGPMSKHSNQSVPKSVLSSPSPTPLPQKHHQQPTQVKSATPPIAETSKQHKPRGPPKKSKEARQALEEESTRQTPTAAETATTVKTGAQSKAPIPTTVIKLGPLASSVIPAAHELHQQPQQKAEKAPKPKRPKKQKQSKDSSAASASSVIVESVAANPSPSAASDFAQLHHYQQHPAKTFTENQVRPSVICSIVRQAAPVQQQQQNSNNSKQSKQKQQKNQQPPTTSSACNSAAAQSAISKLNPQSYIISRPFFSFPTFSTSSAQQLPQQTQMQQQHRLQQPMNLLTTAPMGSPALASLPLQQGARLVWAAQPPRAVAAPVAGAANSGDGGASKTSVSGLSLKNNNTATTRPSVVVSHADNAALLSLATTALSTAPMVSSPAFSHQAGTRAPGPRAIMVNATGSNTQPLYAAAQQYLGPFVPAQFFAGSQMATMAERPVVPVAPGTPMRPPGQLMFARLPNQPQQQRYLITQPGFMQRLQAPQLMANQLLACHLLSAGGGVRAQGAQDAQVRGSK